MANNEPRRIKVVIYPNQLEWLDKIGKVMHRSRERIFLECVAEYIGSFKQEARRLEHGGQA